MHASSGLPLDAVASVSLKMFSLTSSLAGEYCRLVDQLTRYSETHAETTT